MPNNADDNPFDKALDFELQLATMRANYPHLLDAMATVAEQYAAFAKQYRRYFEELTAAGFTPEQALEIVKAHGWMPK